MFSRLYDRLTFYRQWTAVTRSQFYSASLISVRTLSSHILSHLSITHIATIPLLQHHIYNSWRSSGFSFSVFPSTKKHRGRDACCQEPVMLGIAMAWLGLHSSQGRDKSHHDITQIFLKLRSTHSHKLGANHQGCHCMRRMYKLQ